MQSRRALAGPIGAVLLAAAIIGLPVLVPGYSSVRQTVSEIGEVGSPAQLPFTLSLCAVALCILVFASALRGAAVWLVAVMAISAAGVGIFSYPHPLHNVFGTSELIGYQAPLVLAWRLRKDPASRSIASISWVMGGLVWLAILLNCSVFDPEGWLWQVEKPIYGLVQRSLFAVWFGWAALVGLQLAKAPNSRPSEE